jgi:hypothetical protein
VVSGNHISRVQTTRPAYTVLLLPKRWQRTGHGAVEVVAHVFNDEAQWPVLRAALTVEDVAVRDNLIEDAATPGVRVGYGWGESSLWGLRGDKLASALRRYTGAPITNVQLRDNRLLRVPGGLALLNTQDVWSQPACSGNTLDGQPLAPPACAARAGGAAPPITGARVACSV